MKLSEGDLLAFFIAESAPQAILEKRRAHFELEITNVKIPENIPNPEFVGADTLKMETATTMIFFESG